MIATNTAAEVARLLALGNYSQRKIAAMTGVSRGSVGAIASGKRRIYQASMNPRDDAPEEPSGPPTRCTGCGGLVYMPCLLCRVRKMSPRAAVRRDIARPPVSFGLDLRPEHRARYEEVRTARQRLLNVGQMFGG